ncbi:MAG: hypothetical protein A3H96_00410 [Acidobacteria bacterium RIFCSPLOWO2_02_FULL_67_36]|nr:MAG: hypothetical protein A3H96_00410 [Acidobacteria bacterium RIFCSPLOWO2_02_FULL_67_36]OFW23121.1 MAG: hypothetical protein A3G21_00940 [Acidobacteria bacterium RIFCSPLOWO2_12_FULL_66_21]
MIGEGSTLVIGGSGQIGQSLVRSLARRGRHATSTFCRNARLGGVHLDASDPREVAAVFGRIGPAVVINAVNTPGGADACERDPALAHRYHFESGRHLADAARGRGARFVQISTDYVFDGTGGPYAESDPTWPLSQLGRARRDLEKYVSEHADDALIVRTSFVFSWTLESKTSNFVMQIIDSVRDQSPIRVPLDQIGNVTYAPNFADALVELIEKRVTGLFHLAGVTRCSKYEWAMKAADTFGLDSSLIRGVTTAELGQAAPRPLESGFMLDKVRRVLERTRLMSLDEGLAAMRDRMLSASE